MIAAFDALARASELAGKREAMFGGAHVNVTEDRPVEHTAERGEGNPESVRRARGYHARMRALVDAIEAELNKHGKNYEFLRYDGAGHGFWGWQRPGYRQEQAVDSWAKVFAFYEKHLGPAAQAD